MQTLEVNIHSAVQLAQSWPLWLLTSFIQDLSLARTPVSFAQYDHRNASTCTIDRDLWYDVFHAPTHSCCFHIVKPIFDHSQICTYLPINFNAFMTLSVFVNDYSIKYSWTQCIYITRYFLRRSPGYFNSQRAGLLFRVASWCTGALPGVQIRNCHEDLEYLRQNCARVTCPCRRHFYQR